MVRLLICAGGTGGGVYPALVVRQALGKSADPVLWVGSEGGMEAELVQRTGVPYASIPAGQVAGMGLKTLPNLVKVVQGTLASRRILRDFKPDVVLFTGGFVAVPMALAASGIAGRRIPSLVYVPDIEPGLALKLVTRFASTVALTVEEAQAYFPSAHTVVTGYPLRQELFDWTREKALAHLNLQPDRFTLLVAGGSKGARSINQSLLAALPELLKQMQVIHISGSLDWAAVERTQQSLPADLAAAYRPYPYLHEMGAALAAADLAVSRAGASVLGEYPQFGLPAILVPYPYAWRYQKVNADYLVQRGGAIRMEDAELASGLLPAVLDLAADQQRLLAMRQAMTALAQPHAADRLAELVEGLASPRKAVGSIKQDTHNRENKHG